MFVDEAVVELHAGGGGDGCIAFLREKYRPFGGPSGGDGGNGGNIYFRAKKGMNTLQKLRYNRTIQAKRGVHGKGKSMHGHNAEDIIIDIPLGTLLFDHLTNVLIADLVEEGQLFKIATAGRGGRGNARFVTSTVRAPRIAEDGRPGEQRKVRLELRLLADVGLLGYPSVGKSTFIRRVSNARPAIGDYPFTTLTPHLGVVPWREYEEYVIADVPGLIDGAAEGKGLGHQFLRHLERTRLLLHIIEVTPQLEGHEDNRDPIADYERLNAELLHFKMSFDERPQIVALGKIDLPFVRAREAELKAHFEKIGVEFFSFSSETKEGVPALIQALGDRLLKVNPNPSPPMLPKKEDVKPLLRKALSEEELNAILDEMLLIPRIKIIPSTL